MATIEIELHAKEIALTSRRSDLIEFVKDLDEAVGEWGFTIALCDYFEEKRKEYDGEQAGES